jgi:subtilisin-like proprotein convertase family protein
MGERAMLASSVAIDHDGSCPSFTGGGNPCRWGNYVALVPDPTTTGTVWGVNQVNGPDRAGQGQWQTRIFALADAPVATLVHNATTATDGGDNVIEPGEQFTIAEQLRNIGGAAATGINGTLTAKTSSVVINQGGATYPDIAPNSNATNAPPFQATMPATAKCGKTLAMNLRATTAQGQFDVPVSVSSGALGPLAIFDAGPPQVPVDIPEQGTVTSTITVPQSGLVKRAVVALSDLQHSFVSDLDVTIRAPDGTTVPLVMRRGAGGDNFTNTNFDDSAATRIGDGTAPYTGNFKPDSPLAALQGHAMKGTWTLTIHDMFAPDGGMLVAWGLRLNPAAC